MLVSCILLLKVVQILLFAPIILYQSKFLWMKSHTFQWKYCNSHYYYYYYYLFAQLLCHILNNVNKSGIIVQDYFSNNGQVDDQKRSVFLRTNRSVSKYSTYTMSCTMQDGIPRQHQKFGTGQTFQVYLRPRDCNLMVCYRQ